MPRPNSIVCFFWFCLIWLFGPSPECALAQEYPILHYTNADGLPSNTVYSMYRDSKGFLWIATNKGIARYNGSNFETFTTFDGLPDNEIFFFEEDPQQRLWLGCNNGALCYFKNDTFFTAENKENLKLKTTLTHTHHIEVEYDSSLTFSFAGTKFINIRKDKITYFDLAQIRKQVNDNICVLQKKISDNLYKIVYPDSSYFIDTNMNIRDRKKNSYKIARFTSCQKQTYFYGKEYYSTIDNDTGKELPQMVAVKNFLKEIYEDDKTVFFATGNGLVINDSIRLFKGQKVSSVTKDAYGNIWVSTLNSGIYCLSNRKFNIKLYKDVYDGTVTYTYTDGKQIFFATDQSELYHLSDNKVTNLISKEYLTRYGIAGLYQPSFYIDSNYRYYNFYENTALNIDDLRSSPLSVHVLKNATLKRGIKVLFLLNNTLYAKTYNHIDSLSKKNGAFLGVVAGGNADKIFGMAQDADNQLWYSTLSSVYKIENNRCIEQEQLKNLSFNYFDFTFGYLIGIRADNSLVIINNYSGDPIIDTIPSQHCIWEGIHKLDSNHVIIRTNNCHTILTLYKSAGKPKYSVHILENSFIPQQAESIIACGQTVYFFNNGSITSINKDKLFYAPPSPKLFFTRILTSKKTYAASPLVTIPFNESKTLKISFASLSFSNVQLSRQYAIFKNGQYAWTDFNADEINLVNPGYGDYIVMLRAKTFSSAYSDPITLTLRILRPFWASWWFITLLFCLACLLLAALVHYTRRAALRATQKKNLQMELELKAIYAQLNPHFIFNTLNSALLFVRKKRFDDAYTHISQFSRLLRNYIKSSRNKLITIADEIGNLKDYLELQKTRFAYKFEFIIFVEQTIDPYAVKIPSLLLQPFVENALNHGLLPGNNTGHLKIEFVTGANKGELICIIDDDGVGREASQRNKENKEGKDASYGDLLIRDLVNIFNKYEQMNIEIKYIDKKGPVTGTTVYISIKHPHYD